MSGVSGRKLIVGVTGSIAAYKAAILVRELIRGGSEVRVAMTDAASHFIAPLTFASLSKHPVALHMFPAQGAEPASGAWHIDWAVWADAMVIAPASAATIAKLAAGISDNALTVLATALRGKLFVAPAMDHDMYVYPAMQRNLETLESFGARIIPPGEGELASGLYGPGRMAEPEEIVEVVAQHFETSRALEGRRVLVTAGPTHEPIDPVRYIANRSSGKMGYAVAEEARDRGASVTLVSGPTALTSPAGVTLVPVTTAQEMASAVDENVERADVVIAAAAVADFTPTVVGDQKLKRREMSNGAMSLELKPTHDILRSIGERRRDDQVIVGFALETSALVESARAKLTEKRCDIVVANSAIEPGVGIGADVNRIVIVSSDGETALPPMSKRACAARILDEVEKRLVPAPMDSPPGTA